MILPGPHPKDIAQAAATRSLLRALRMDRDTAAGIARVSRADLDALLDGQGHAPLWGALAARWCDAAGVERDQSPPRELLPTPKEMRKALGVRRR